jgi:hypothetical protein
MSLSLEQASSGTFVFAKAGLAIGSTTSQLSRATAVPFCIDGVFATNLATSATFAMVATTGYVINTVIPVGNKSAFGVWVDAAGAVTVTQGAITPYSVSTDKAAPPPNPGARALVGVAVVTNPSLAANGGFRPGTDALATTVTTAYHDTFSPSATGYA